MIAVPILIGTAPSMSATTGAAVDHPANAITATPVEVSYCRLATQRGPGVAGGNARTCTATAACGRSPKVLMRV
jgi:hypothetical protein